MSEHPDTDALEEADFAKYGDEEDVPIACYHRMTAHAREMEAAAKACAKMLGEAWEDLKEARFIAKESCEMLAENGFEVNYPPMPWESPEANDQDEASFDQL